MKSFWTRKFEFNQNPIERHPETQVEKTTDQMSILGLKQEFLWTDIDSVAARTMSFYDRSFYISQLPEWKRFFQEMGISSRSK